MTLPIPILIRAWFDEFFCGGGGGDKGIFKEKLCFKYKFLSRLHVGFTYIKSKDANNSYYMSHSFFVNKSIINRISNHICRNSVRGITFMKRLIQIIRKLNIIISLHFMLKTKLMIEIIIYYMIIRPLKKSLSYRPVSSRY